MKVVTAEDMRNLDAQTISAGTPGVVLMERAGTGAFEELLAYIKRVAKKHCTSFNILAGKGNNGGDGYVIARLLSENTEYYVRVLSVCQKNELKGDAKLNANHLPKQVDFVVGDHIPDEWLRTGNVFIDCLLGTGFSGALREPYNSLINIVNKSKCIAIAIDIPSGVNADTGDVDDAAICADLTITFGLPKPGLFLNQGHEFSGITRLVDIGIPNKFTDEKNALFNVVFHQDIKSDMQRLSKNAHKSTMGKILIIGGSRWYPGAPLLSGLGALRSGGGLVSVAYPSSIAPLMQLKELALILTPVNDEGLGFHSITMIKEYKQLMEDKNAIVLGPGLSLQANTIKLVQRLLETDKTIVLDADALTAFASHIDMFPRSGTTILTPHSGEMTRIINASGKFDLLKKSRISQAKILATQFRVYIILKGNGTVIASPEGEVLVNSSGTPALATGGTGDVLTGMIAASLCQFGDVLTALKVAVFIHGLAAEFAPNGMRNLIADDLLGLIGTALKDVTPFA